MCNLLRSKELRAPRFTISEAFLKEWRNLTDNDQNGIISDGGPDTSVSWWRHQMETFSALLAICAGNSPVNGDFPAQRPVTRSFDVFFDLPLNNGWVNNREAVDLRRYLAHYDVSVMFQPISPMHSHENVRKLQIWLVSWSQTTTKTKKINRPRQKIISLTGCQDTSAYQILAIPPMTSKENHQVTTSKWRQNEENQQTVTKN